jgi:phosphomethylpyrimidine synthase
VAKEKEGMEEIKYNFYVSFILYSSARELHDETMPRDANKFAHFCSMCGPNYFLMKITQDVCEYPKKGMQELAVKFMKEGSDINIKV